MPVNKATDWCDHTWNPVRGCSKISPGCRNCSAESFRGVPGPFEQDFDVRLVPRKLLQPLHWPTPGLIFVNAKSDLFHAEVPDRFIIASFEVMSFVDWHIYQVTTKRADRMCELANTQLQNAAGMEHIWWGVCVEDRKHGLPRLEALRNANVAKRFLSLEPLLEDLGTINLDGIDWVIVAGESANKARPMEKDWVLSIRDQCAAAEVPFLFKHWAGYPKSKFECAVDGTKHRNFPLFPPLTPPKLHERRILEAALEHCIYEQGILKTVA